LDQSKLNVSFWDHHGMDETIMDEDIPQDVDYDKIQLDITRNESARLEGEEEQPVSL